MGDFYCSTVLPTHRVVVKAGMQTNAYVSHKHQSTPSPRGLTQVYQTSAYVSHKTQLTLTCEFLCGGVSWPAASHAALAGSEGS